ncbi:MAG: DUF4255 domain-containing protein [Anaerolineae bacterium]|nr:DUF4255 domain-containing protein [Anaerolineae bacterium]
MALLDISLVTQALVKLIETRVKVLLKEHVPATSTVWPLDALLTVSPEPPDSPKEGDVLTFYLYHLSEDGHFKNLAPSGNDQSPIRYTPMGLNLYYQLCARSDLQDATGAYREQLLLGLAVKTLRDYPCIDDSTELIDVNNQTVKILEETELAGAGNRLRINLHPVPNNEAVSYWTAGSLPLRLAAYYQVSLVLLEPEKSRTRTGRVLTYGVHAFVGGAPHLYSSQNVVTFKVPNEADLRQIELRPAQATPAAPPTQPLPPPSVASKITFAGANLTGDCTYLLLKNTRWKDPVQVGSTWEVVVTENHLMAVVQETAGAEGVLPGIYAALVKVIRRRTMPDGKVREFEYLSNEAPFVIAPRIGTITSEANGTVTVTGYIFQHSELKPDALQLYVGGERLAAKAEGVPGVGEFVVTDANTLTLRPPAKLISSGWVPLRIFVNGAESPPKWIKV